MSDKKLYYAFSAYLKQKFGCPVKKLCINAGFTCPNRDGTCGRDGCIYCDSFGSGKNDDRPIAEQIDAEIRRARNRVPSAKFIAYFQNYSNTYAPVEICKQRYDEILPYEDIVALAVGARPDCITENHLALLSSYCPEREVWLELGLQSTHDSSLQWMRRGHDFKTFQSAADTAKRYPLKLCAHIIFGIPGESREDMLDTVRYCARAGLHGIKFHCLYVTESAPLAAVYKSAPFPILSQKEYVSLACDALELLPENMIIQRLVSDDATGGLIAPLWLNEKQKTLSMITEELMRRNSHQGSKY